MIPNRDCPRFDKCSVNNCPLHPEYPELFTSPLDAERVCTLGKTIRVRIARKHPGVLQYGGLKIREYNAKINYELKSGEEKERIKERLEGLKNEAQQARTEQGIKI